MYMKIFFTASYRGKDTYQKQYDKILTKLDQMNLELISPEKSNYKVLLSQKELVDLKDNQAIHYASIKKGIAWADAVIIEISEEDFQLGHEATLTIADKKHVLCLSVNEDYSKKIKNRYFHAYKYNDFSYEQLIEDFIQLVSQEQLINRFNLFISDRQKRKIQEKAKSLGVNCSEYIRILVDKDR